MRRTTWLLAACSIVLAIPAVAQRTPSTAAAARQAPFSLAPLPYPANALEPVIDAKTMETHHGKHHQSYVDNLNKAVSEDEKLSGLTLEQMMARMSSLPTSVRNNGGGHWNHSFFWQIMAPPGKGGAPSPELRGAIEAEFGSLDKMKAAFKQAGSSRFGSGWAWLIVTPEGRLAITSTPNQDNPLMDLAETRGQPILGNDVWEHAYYLTYQNRRGDYLDAWWQVVNWNEVSRRYREATRRR